MTTPAKGQLDEEAPAEESAEEPTVEEPAEELRHLKLEDGSTLVMLPVTWQMMKAIASADSEQADRSTADMMQAIEDACIEANFVNGRPLPLQPLGTFRQIFRAWNAAEDEAALPPANG